jgi:4-aminobutyrate aminotransferase-like enzyme
MSYSAHFRIQPALTLDRETAANGVAILREVFDELKKSRRYEAVSESHA